MGWQPINHICGHTSQEQMYGKMDSRYQRALSLGQYPCPDCKRMQGEERGCKPLMGSDKQCAWAGDIRQAYLSKHPELSAEECANLSQSAKYWIDNRNNL